MHLDLKVSKDLLEKLVSLALLDLPVSWDQLDYPEKTEVMVTMENQDDLAQLAKKVHKVPEVSLVPQEHSVSRDTEVTLVPMEKRETLVPQEKMVTKVTLVSQVPLDFKDPVVCQETEADQEHQDPQVHVDLMEHPDKLDLQDLLETVDHLASLEHLAPREKLDQLAQEAQKDPKVLAVNLVLQDLLDHLV